MRLYYFAPTLNSNITIQKEIEIKPQRHANTAGHLAYAIQQATRPQLTADQRNRVFMTHMQEWAGTQTLINDNPLMNHFDFNSQELSEQLAQYFILSAQDINMKDAVAEEEEKEEKTFSTYPQEEKELAPYQNTNEETAHQICPISLSPICHGIKFAGDPNWYEISSALNWIKSSNSNMSPATTTPWLMIEDYRSFNFPGSVEEDYNYLDRLADIMLTLCSSNISPTPHFPEIPQPPKVNPILNNEQAEEEPLFIQGLILLLRFSEYLHHTAADVSRPLNILNERTSGYLFMLPFMLPRLLNQLHTVNLQHLDFNIQRYLNLLWPERSLTDYFSNLTTLTNFIMTLLPDETECSYPTTVALLTLALATTTLSTLELLPAPENNAAHPEEDEEQKHQDQNGCFTRASAAVHTIGRIVNDNVVTPLWETSTAISNSFYRFFRLARPQPQGQNNNHLPPREHKFN